MVYLAYSIEIHEFAVEVIEHLDTRRLFAKKNLGTTCERLDIGLMFRKHSNDLIGEAVLATDVA